MIKLLILTLLLCVQCNKPLSPLEEHVKKTQQKFERKQFSNFWKFYFLHKNNRISFGIYDIGRNTNIRVLQLNSFSSTEITLTGRRMLRNLVLELAWKMQTTKRRRIHPTWYGLYGFLNEVEQSWRR